MRSKRLLLPALLMSTGVFLAACNSDNAVQEDSGESDGPGAQDMMEETIDEQGPEDVPGAEAEESDEEKNASDSTVQNRASEEGALTQSDNQNFEIYVLEGYELSAEEPGKDALYASEDPGVFMRIETFTTEEADFEFVEETMTQTIQATNENEEVSELESFSESQFTSSSVKEIPTEEGKVTGVAYEKEGLIVRLTIFDNDESNATNDFIEMGKTIQATN